MDRKSEPAVKVAVVVSTMKNGRLSYKRPDIHMIDLTGISDSDDENTAPPAKALKPSSVSTPTTGQNLSIYQPSATAGKQSTIPIIGLKGSVTEIGEDNEVIPVYRRLNSLKTDPRKHTERKRDFFAMSTGGNRIADASFIVQKGRAGSPAAETTDPMKDYYAARVVYLKDRTIENRNLMRQKGNEMMQKFKIRFDTGLCAFMDAKYAFEMNSMVESKSNQAKMLLREGITEMSAACKSLQKATREINPNDSTVLIKMISDAEKEIQNMVSKLEPEPISQMHISISSPGEQFIEVDTVRVSVKTSVKSEKPTVDKTPVCVVLSAHSASMPPIKTDIKSEPANSKLVVKNGNLANSQDFHSVVKHDAVLPDAGSVSQNAGLVVKLEAAVPKTKPKPHVKAKPPVTFSHAAETLRQSLMRQLGVNVPAVSFKYQGLQESQKVRARRLAVRQEAEDVEVSYLRGLETYIRRCIQSGDTAHIITQLSSLINGRRFQSLPSCIFLLKEIASIKSNENEIAIIVFIYLYRNCIGEWQEKPIGMDITGLILAVKRVFDIAKSNIANVVSDVAPMKKVSYNHSLNAFVGVISEILYNSKLICPEVQANSWISFFIDIIEQHMRRIVPSSSQKSITYGTAMGPLSLVLMQHSLDLINLLFLKSNRVVPMNAMWSSFFACEGKGFVPLDSIYFLRQFSVCSPLNEVFVALASEQWEERHRVVITAI